MIFLGVAITACLLLAWLFFAFLTLEFFELDGGCLVGVVAILVWPLFWLMWVASKAADLLRRKVG